MGGKLSESKKYSQIHDVDHAGCDLDFLDMTWSPNSV